MMRRISIERYKATEPYSLPDGTPVTSITDWFSGLVEGERDDGTTWIMWLDDKGSPALFWGDRDPSGAVIGDPILLKPLI